MQQPYALFNTSQSIILQSKQSCPWSLYLKPLQQCELVLKYFTPKVPRVWISLGQARYSRPRLAPVEVLGTHSKPYRRDLSYRLNITFAGSKLCTVSSFRFLVALSSSRSPKMYSPLVLQIGATNLKKSVDPAVIGDVLVACNAAIMKTFYVSVALAALSIFGALAMEWQSVKGKKIDAVAA